MIKFFFIIPGFILYLNAYAQPLINRQQFFLDERLIGVTLTTDIKKLRNEKKIPAYQPAKIIMHFPDSAVITEDVLIQPRGEFRKLTCDIASLMINFRTPSSPKLSPLKRLKFVGGCSSSMRDEELLLKEYLVYKTYNFITNMSFRVRLLHVTYNDSKLKTKSYKQYAFLIEDTDDMAKRNNCIEIQNRKFGDQATNRYQMTLVNIFQYMIGNTDWSILNYHNIKLMAPKNDTFALPYLVPYDFDYCGFVNPPYAVPDEQFGNKTVTERVYRGYPRSSNELSEAITIFNQKKESILLYVNQFPFLNIKTKRLIVSFLDDFYDTINSKNAIRSIFKGTKD